MKKAELTFAVVSVPLDYIMIVLAGISAYFLRYAEWVQKVRPIIFDLPYGEYVSIVFFVALAWLPVFGLLGMYSLTMQQRLIDELSKVVFACSTGLMLIVMYIFWQREFFDSRFIILAAYILSILYVGGGRIILRYIRRLLLLKDWGVTKVVLVGGGKVSDELASLFHRKPIYGYRVMERVEVFDEARFSDLIKKISVDEIILADTDVTKDIRSGILNYCYSHHIGFRYIADIFDAQSHNVDIRSLMGFPIIEIKKTPLDGWGRIIKRFFDICFGIMFLVVLVPLSLVIGLVIKLDSRGPVFVRLKRVGKEGTMFTMYKFRSMIEGAHLLKYDEHGNLREDMARLNQRSDGPLFKIDNDPRVTRFGKVLRRTSLDELPQIINVLKGEMSLVGPRPHEPEEVQRYESKQQKLLSIKPGMTGLGQISGRSNLTFEEEVKLDLYYIENWSLKDDLQILFKTFWVVLFRKNAI